MLRVPLLNPQPRAKSQPTAYRGLSKLRRVGRSLSEGATKSCTVASPLQPLDVSLEEHLDIKNNGQMDGLNRDADNDSLFSRSVTIQKLREDSSRLWSARVLLSDQQDNGYVTRDRAVKVHRGSEDETEDEVYYWLGQPLRIGQ